MLLVCCNNVILAAHACKGKDFFLGAHYLEFTCSMYNHEFLTFPVEFPCGVREPPHSLELFYKIKHVHTALGSATKNRQ